MDFGRALGMTFTIGSGRRLKEGETDDTEQVGWNHGLVGVAILIVAQLGLIFWGTAGVSDAELIRDLSIAAFGALLVPFALFAIVAALNKTTARLPAAFLYLGVSLAVLQVVSGLLASFGTGQSGFLIGLLFAVVFLAARGFLKLHWFLAILVGLLVVAGFIGANLLLLMLPSGRLLR
jgi:hypothetical protein